MNSNSGAFTGFPGWNGETPNTPRPGWAIEEYLEQLVHTAAVLALPPVTDEDNGDFMTVVDGEWAPADVTLDEKIAEDVGEWLEDHPEATTTVQDGAITNAKLASSFVTPGTASAYSSSATYAVGDYVFHDGALYRCTTPITTAEAWTAAHWTTAMLGDDVGDLKSEITYIPASTLKDYMVLGKSVTAAGEVNNTATSSLSGYIAVNPNEVYTFPNIKDANNVQLYFYIATYTDNNSASFISRTLVNGSQLAISSNVKYIRVMFSRPGASGVTMTQAHIDAYFDGKIYNMGLKINELFPLLNRQVWFDLSKMNLVWNLGKSVDATGNVTNLSTSALTYYIDAYSNEVFVAPVVLDANSVPITTYIACYNSNKEFVERITMSNKPYIIGNTTKYIRIMFSRASATGITMTTTDIETYFGGFLYQMGHRIQQKLSDLEKTDWFVPFKPSTTWSMGYTVAANGDVKSATTYALSEYVNRNKIIGIQTIDATDNNGNKFYTFVACFDRFKRYLGRFAGNVILPQECEYIRFVFGRLASTDIMPTQNTVNTYFKVNEITRYYLMSGKANIADTPKNVGVRNCLLRAKQLAMLTYKTKGILPNQVSDIPANTVVTGVPYSSARLYDKFIGLNVSLHTFMTAINNPRSIVYEEYLTTPNAKTFYGTVCSSFTAYCLGSPVREVTKKILQNTADYTTKDVNDIQLGDICVNDGHIVLIVGINRDFYGGIVDVITSESLPPKCVITSYTWDKFVSYVEASGYRVASYNDISKVNYIPSKYVPLMDEEAETITYSPICTYYGDKPLLPVNTDVELDVLDNSNATGIVVYKGDTLIQSLPAQDTVLSNLEEGNYEARLMNGESVLGKTQWAICSAEISKSGDRVSFGNFKNCTPQYISFNDRTGSAFYCIRLTDEDIENGYVDTDYVGTGVDWLKIYVGHDYGSTSFGTYIS